MKQGGRIRTELHYFSDRLLRKLEEVQFAHATVVEAPSGYGKTTAVRDYLEAKRQAGIPVYWFTATEETPSAGFRRLCREISSVDDEAGQRLLRFDLPNAVTIGEVCDAIRSIRCRHETYLVIDNYHLLHDALPVSFFLALIEHGGQGLHVVILTQVLTRGMVAAVAGRGFLHITTSDLRLNAGDISQYYSLAGVRIAAEEAREIERYTEGWIIAIYLQLCAYQEQGSLSDTTGILSLMENLVWDKLTPEQQTFLLRVSPFEMFTMQQACFLADCDSLPEYAQAALAGPFIRFDRTERRYETHSILSKLLAEKRLERGKAFNRECLIRAGDWCRDAGATADALASYWQTRDYDRILSLDLSHVLVEDIGGTPFPSIALDIAQKCPAEVKRRNVLSMLRIAWALYLAGMRGPFDTLMAELRAMLGVSARPEGDGQPHAADLTSETVGAPGGVRVDDTAALTGEWFLLSSYREFPDIPKMVEILEVAGLLLRGQPSQVVLPSAPWWFGRMSAAIDWNVIPGEAERVGEELEKFVALYTKLTNGHGSGADALYKACLAYQRGDLSGAEVHAYKASFLAESRQQSYIQLEAAILLGEIALQKADAAGWQHAVDSMERAASYPHQNTPVLRSALDIARGVLLVELQAQDGLAEWLRDGDFSGRLLPGSAVGGATLVHTMYLLTKGEAARMLGTLETGLLELGTEGPFAELLVSMLLAWGYVQIGDHARATRIVEKAAECAIPDGLISPLISFSFALKGITDELVKRKYPHLWKQFRTIKRRWGRGWNTVHSNIVAEDLPEGLTARELEVARLAAKGLRNSEIAVELYLSEATVRAHLRTVFQKLDIDRRTKLAEKLS